MAFMAVGASQYAQIKLYRNPSNRIFEAVDGHLHVFLSMSYIVCTLHSMCVLWHKIMIEEIRQSMLG